MPIWFSLSLPTDDVSVAFSVPGAGSDTSGAKDILADPADDGLWEFVDDLHVSRYIEVRHPGRAEVEQLGAIQCGVRSDRDTQQDVVLTEVAGHTDSRSLEHRRMVRHNCLDFDGRDVLAAAAQRIFHPVHVGQVLLT